MLIPFKRIEPDLHDSVYLAPGACVIGDVVVGKNSSIWFGAVIRGDVDSIRIGKGSNIQDGSVIHTSRYDGPTVIGDFVTIGHKAVIHACTLANNSFVGMGAIVMDDARVEEFGFVAAGAVVPPGKIVKSYELWAGVPAKLIRKLDDKDIEEIKESAKHYIKLAEHYIKRR
jgi:carbonic anhydrase/acetyltransferase-like protein (isoleucine patch superfamily)